MNPVSWIQEKRGFYMSKLTYEDKINIYIDKKGECQQEVYQVNTK